MLTVDRMLRDRARITPNRVAIDEGGRLWTYGELDERSDDLARRLPRGDRVSTLTGNSGEHVVVFFACAKAGLRPGERHDLSPALLVERFAP